MQLLLQLWIRRRADAAWRRYNYKLPRYNQMMNALTWMSHSQNLRRMASEYVIDLCAPSCVQLQSASVFALHTGL